jgi:dienelactone hydrolase
MKDKPVITQTAAELFVADIKTSCDFFTQKLGFSIVFVYGEPPFYAQVKRDRGLLNLKQMDAPVIDPQLRDREELLSSDMGVSTAAEIKALFLEFQAAGAAFFQPLRKEPWGPQTSSSRIRTATCCSSRGRPRTHKSSRRSRFAPLSWRPTLMIRLTRTLRLAAACVVSLIAHSAPAFPQAWPDGESLARIQGEAVSFPSFSPFTPADMADTAERVPTPSVATFFKPNTTGKAPAIVLLHGSSGVQSARELTYARQFAAMGVAALVVDSFAARRERGTGFIDRLLNITESMILADAYAGLGWLGARPDIDPERIAVVGFSYGALVSLLAAQDQVARIFAPGGQRFAGHVAFYAPCIAVFDDRTTTGKPVLMLAGDEDEIVKPERCDTAAANLRAGGSEVQVIRYPGAYHQWDGAWSGPRRIGRTLDGCRLRVASDGTVQDRNTMLPMIDSFTRKIILGLCSDSSGYLIGRDDAVRARSNADLGRFLARALKLKPAL